MEALKPGSALDPADDIPYEVPIPLYEEINEVLPVHKPDVAVPPLPPPRPLPRPQSRGNDHSQQPLNADPQPPGRPRANALDIHTQSPPPPRSAPQDTLPTSDEDGDVDEYEPLLLGEVVNDPYMDLQLLQNELDEDLYESPFNLQPDAQVGNLSAASSSSNLRHNPTQTKMSEVRPASSSPTPVRSSSESSNLDMSLLTASLDHSTPLDISSMKELSHLDQTQMQMWMLIQMQQMLQTLQESYQMVIPGNTPSALPQSSFVPPSDKGKEDASRVSSSLRRRVEALESSIATSAPLVPPRTTSSPLLSSATATAAVTEVPSMYDEVARSSDDDEFEDDEFSTSSDDDESEEYTRYRKGIYEDITTIDFTTVVQESKHDKEHSRLDNESPLPKPKLALPPETEIKSAKPSVPPKPFSRQRPASFTNELRKPPVPSPRSRSLRDKVRDSSPKNKLVSSHSNDLKPVSANCTPQSAASSAPRAGLSKKNSQKTSNSPQKGGAQAGPTPAPRFNRRSKKDAADMMRKVLGEWSGIKL